MINVCEKHVYMERERDRETDRQRDRDRDRERDQRRKYIAHKLCLLSIMQYVLVVPAISKRACGCLPFHQHICFYEEDAIWVISAMSYTNHQCLSPNHVIPTNV